MMYSKEKGFTHAPAGEILHRRPHRAPRVSVPPNYRGHAIVDGEERPLGSLNGDHPHAPAKELAAPDAPVLRFDDLPRVSQLGDSHRRQTPTYLPAPAYAEATASPEETDLPASGTAPHRPPQNTAAHGTPQNTASPHESSPPVVPLPRHSLGTLSLGLEELLLLGLILFLLMENSDCSDRGDLDETVILLGLLLLLG